MFSFLIRLQTVFRRLLRSFFFSHLQTVLWGVLGQTGQNGTHARRKRYRDKMSLPARAQFSPHDSIVFVTATVELPGSRGYHEKVIDHYENPRNVGSMDKNDANVGTGLVGAPACGDVMKLQVSSISEIVRLLCHFS